MGYVTSILLSVSLLLSSSLLGVWGSDVMSIDAIKYYNTGNQITHVRGTIVENLGYEGFTIIDDTGEIRICFTNNDLRHFSFHPGMRVEVRGKVSHKQKAWDIQASAIHVLNTALIGQN